MPGADPSREHGSAPSRPSTGHASTPVASADHFHGSSHSSPHSWFHNPCNRYVCWHGHSGCQFGYVFCGSSLYWYWWWPGCAPCFTPYSYYWSPYCHYLPAYYPSYASVTYVHDYYDDGEYYPSYEQPAESGESVEAAPSGADAATLIAAGWDQFRNGDYPEAVESFRQAVLANPDDPQAKIGYAQVLFAIGAYPTPPS